MPAAPVAAQEGHGHHASGAQAGLGTVTFANSGAAAARAPFLRGLALLRSFEYDQAAEAFRAAQAADPAFAMAYWGEALTYSHLLWGEDDVAGARRALGRLAARREARLAKAGTPRERAFGDAIEALFVEAGDAERIRGFAGAMRKLAAEYPSDPDALSFAALGAMFTGYASGVTPADRDAARSSAIDYAEKVFANHPNHPGGAHYLIHACDDPAFAARGLAAARRYAEIAPDAEHALHMPSHIFVQLGLWPDTVASNERSWAASAKEVAARKLTNADLSFHAMLFKQYAQLQLGQYRASRAAIAQVKAALAGVDLTKGAHVDARYAVSELAFQHAAVSGDWSDEICKAIGPPPPADVPPGAAARDQSFRVRATYQAAMAAVMCGRPAPATDGLGGLQPIAARHAELLAYARGATPSNLEALLADPTPPSRAPVGPPPILRIEELLGEARLKAGRASDAVAAYERALTLTPNRSPALLGLARARHAAPDLAALAEARSRAAAR
jgi:tetratricopeptide (TPR) repeat protein